MRKGNGGSSRRRRTGGDASSPPPSIPPSIPPSAAVPRPTVAGARAVGGPAPTAPTRPLEQTAAPARRSITPAAPDMARPPPVGSRPTPTPRPQRPAGAAPSYPPRGAASPPGPPPPSTSPATPPPGPRPARRRRRGRRGLTMVVVLLVLLVAWPVGLLVWANGKINRVEALSGGADTPGRTYLLAGSDSRADGPLTDATEGERSDTIMVLHAPTSGAASLISIPRDTYVDIPGHGGNKINAAYARGGPPLLVSTVEGLTGLTIDHYVEIGMGGMLDIVDAVGGVELCLDYDVDDWRSELRWTAGCHEADGETALAFAR